VLEPIRREFGLNDTMLGVLSTAFVLVYALAGIPIARLADRHSRLRVLSVGVVVWSLLTAATGLAKNFSALLLFRIGVGVGEASCAPAANALIGDMYPPDRRARPMGLFMLGLPLGAVMAFALGGWLAQEFGWRTAFFVAAFPGLIAAALIPLAREPARGAQESYRVGSQQPFAQSLRTLLSITTLWWIILSGAAINFAAYSLNTFLPSLLVRYHGTSVGTAGSISAIVLGLTGIVGLLVGGRLADSAHRRWRCGRLWLGGFSLLTASPLMAWGLMQPQGQLMAVTVLLSASWLLLFLYYVTVYPAIQDVVRPELRATGMAVYFMFMYLLGGGLGTLFTGALSDSFAIQAMLEAGATAPTEQFRAIGLRESLLWVMPGMMLLTAISLFLATRSYDRDVRSCNLSEAP
jgi:predicted MFS family arabinose efflux permease